MSDGNGKLFTAFSGLPTAPDVKRLVDHYGVPSPGLIPYEDLVELLGIQRGSRFDTVLDVWRNKLRREHALYTTREANVGLHVLTNEQMVDDARDRSRAATRRQRFATVEAAAIDVAKIEDPKARARAEHLKRTTTQMFIAMSEGVKALQPPAPPKQLPRG